MAEVCQVEQLLGADTSVVYAQFLGAVRASELAQTEVFGKLHVLKGERLKVNFAIKREQR